MSGAEDVLGWAPRPLAVPTPPAVPDAPAVISTTPAPVVNAASPEPVEPQGVAPLSRRALREQNPLPEIDDRAIVEEWVAGRPSSTPSPARSAADPQLLAALQEVVACKASDLHVTANAAPMLRVDGGLRAAPGTMVWDRDRVKNALYSLLTDEQREQFEQELELDFAYTVSANARFRVNFYQQRDSIGAAFRLIPTEIKTLKALGVPEHIGRFAGLPRGLVLVTGPTGSGKSTTLAALIDLVNETRTDHIVTVEDPIEFLHNHKKSIINQREVGHDTHSFANALKHVLRQDPDVILVGELRDLETISVALTAAETGHLVFATLHTQDAAQTIDRVIDVFPPHQQDQVRVQLAATLQGVVCQTLIKKANGEGRVVATEVLVTTPAVGNLIREGKTYQIASAMQAGRDLGMHTMDQNLAELVNSGKITREAALEKSHDPAAFDRLIHRVETATDATSRALQSAGPDFGDSFSRVVQ
ncbi:PilT/PilU family type 4a pilus ATPase [Gryllotalpicola koreensis]